MKRLSIIASLVFLGFVTFSCSSSSEKEVKEVTEVLAENVITADYSVEGMVCAMGCAKTIQDELAEMNGITACTVNFEEGKAHVEYDKTQLSENEIVALIEGMADGKYKVSEWQEKNEVEESTTSEESVEIDESEENDEGEQSLTEVEVVLPDFEIPNLFSLLFNQV